MKILVIFLIVLFSIEDVFSSTYYVSKDGNDSGPGTIDKPFQSIQQAIDLLNPGDYLIVKDGEYRNSISKKWLLRINISGTRDHWITIKSENSLGAILNGEKSVNYGVVFFAKAQYIRFEGFVVKNMKNSGISANQAQNIAIVKNHIHHNGNIMIADCSDGYGRTGVYLNPLTKYFIFADNIINSNGRYTNNSCNSLKVSDNHNYRHDHGLYLQGKNHVIEGNIFYDHAAGYSIKVDGYWDDAEDTETFNSIIINNTFGKQARRDKYSGGVIRFFNNMSVSQEFGQMKNPRVLIKNNIFYQPGGVQADTAIRISNNENSNFSNTVIENNITTSKYLYSENIGDNITKNVTAIDNLLSTDPKIDFSNHNKYSLLEDSPAINKNRPVNINYDNYGFLPENKPDIGAASQ